MLRHCDRCNGTGEIDISVSAPRTVECQQCGGTGIVGSAPGYMPACVCELCRATGAIWSKLSTRWRATINGATWEVWPHGKGNRWRAEMTSYEGRLRPSAQGGEPLKAIKTVVQHYDVEDPTDG